MNKALLSISAILFCLSIHAQVYKNPNISAEKRVANLLNKMTIDEKIAQLRSFHMARPKLTAEVLNNPIIMDSLFKNGIGMMNPDFDAKAEETINRRNALQKYLKEKTRLGIPTLFTDEAHHGLLAPGADIFPTSIALASSWDTSLIKRVYEFIAAEAAAKGTHWVLAPVVDVCRDPRWGRTGETYGEDPFLCGILGSAVVKGYQGSDDGKVLPGHVAATLKHFTGHGQSEGGINQAPANYSERTLREMHMESFRLCINNAKPVGIMAAYCEIDGVPAHANQWLLKHVLREEWHYKGIVVSDWWAIDQLWKKHHIEANEKSATARAFNAGVTIDLPFGNNFKHLSELIKERKVSLEDVDSAVSYILAIKFKMGLFEQPEFDLKKVKEIKARQVGRILAQEAAEKSMVLLKNNDQLLPLNINQYKKIAVIGPCAAVNYLGDYSGIPIHNVSILEGLKNKTAGRDIKILYHKGVDLTTNGDTVSMNNYQYISTAIFPNPDSNFVKIAEAKKIAFQSDIIIVAVGENEQLSREAGTDRIGDMATLKLVSQQDELVRAMIETGKPVIVYLSHARPYAVNYIAENANAIIDGWFCGEEAGNAFANILFGDINPSGKLTISVPRSVGQLPVYYNYKPSARAYDYVTEKNTPLFPFGFGLSYTRFFYSQPQIVSKTKISKGILTQIQINISNTGTRTGEETVQLYIHDKVSSVTRPVKELKAFQKIKLRPGETKTLIFDVTEDMLKFWNKDMLYKAEPGEFEILLGPNSTELQKINYLLN